MGLYTKFLVVVVVVVAVLYARSFQLKEPTFQQAKKMTRGNVFLTSTGRTVEYVDYGPHDSETVVVALHGHGMSCNGFSEWKELVESRGSLRLVALSLPGWGCTSFTRNMTVAANDLTELLSLVGLSDRKGISLLSISMGTFYAMGYAAANPQISHLYQVVPLVPTHEGYTLQFPNWLAKLFSTPPLDRLLGYYLIPMMTTSEMLGAFLPDDWPRFTQTKWHPGLLSDVDYARGVTLYGPVESIQLLRADADYPKYLEALAKRQVTIEIHSGRQDQLNHPRNGEYLQRAYQGQASIKMWEGGHLTAGYAAIESILTTI